MWGRQVISSFLSPVGCLPGAGDRLSSSSRKACGWGREHLHRLQLHRLPQWAAGLQTVGLQAAMEPPLLLYVPRWAGFGQAVLWAGDTGQGSGRPSCGRRTLGRGLEGTGTRGRPVPGSSQQRGGAACPSRPGGGKLGVVLGIPRGRRD